VGYTDFCHFDEFLIAIGNGEVENKSCSKQ
jgi:hypothetical protein